MSYTTWFVLNKDGLAQVVDMWGKVFVLKELIQNGWDAGASRVDVTLAPIKGRRDKARLVVKDDSPTGFEDISHSYTFYAQSPKKADPTLRGRFDIGEKLVLALCDEAKIVSMNDAIAFKPKGRRQRIRERTESGTTFEGVVRMTKEELADASRKIFLLLPPSHIVTTFNGVTIPTRVPVATFEATLPTVFADDKGYLRPSARKTTVALYAPFEGETPTLFELGVPIVDSQTSYHVDVQQRVPLTQDRNNVTPSYLRRLVTAVVNHMHDAIPAENLQESWVNTALEDRDADPEAVRSIVRARFGDKVVSYDLSDAQAGNEAKANGYVVVHGGSLSAAAWENIRAAGAVPPAGQVFPTPRPFSDDPNAPQAEMIPEADWTKDMADYARVAKRLGKKILGCEIYVVIVRRMNSSHRAAWDAEGKRLILSLQGLGRLFFENWRTNMHSSMGLLIHEYTHDLVSDHLDAAFYKGEERIGGRLIQLALDEPLLWAPDEGTRLVKAAHGG